MFHNKKIFIFISIVVLFSTSLYANDSFSLTGYYKNFFTILNPPNSLIMDGKTRFSDSNNIRLDINWAIYKSTFFNTAYNLSAKIQDPGLFSLNEDENKSISYRVDDLNPLLYGPEGSFGIYQNLDRAYFSGNLGFADLFLGRQAIAWGGARVINPTDVIVPFQISDIDKEERIGVDALRLRIPTGELNELDIGCVFGKDFEFKESALYVRNRAHPLNTDLTLIAIDFKEHLLVGLDIARSIRGAGFWCETAYTFSYLFNDSKRDKNEDYLRLSTGLDYSFTDKFYGYFEYHFNEPGATNTDDYLSAQQKAAFTDGSVYLLSEQYLIPGFSYQITALTMMNISSLINILDNSLFLSPNIEYNIFEDFYLSLGAFIGIGKEPEEISNTPVYKSEFGSYTDLYFTSLRIYF
ncbi:MAG: hypothetical protein ABII27_06975 [bacterium]